MNDETVSGSDLYEAAGWPRRSVLKFALALGATPVFSRAFVTLAADGTPTRITFNGRLHGEAELLAVAHADQAATEFHLQRPPVAQST